MSSHSMSKLSGWGNYPSHEVRLHRPNCTRDINALNLSSYIARGSGRSYGDSSLAEDVVSTLLLDDFIEFDRENGYLHCQSGLTLDEILKVIVPAGWFLSVTPGTKFVTLGGAIASDVHGKNHHVEGSFCDFVGGINLLLPDGKQVWCSSTENKMLFHASCGGMGLTGVILDAKIKLKKITASSIRQITLKADNLDHILELFETHASATYSVAWIDCLAKGDKIGQSLLMLGEHMDEGSLNIHKPARFGIPFSSPSLFINKYSMSWFNELYYWRGSTKNKQSIETYDSFFYPLDFISQWNNLYGGKGFLQYQFVLPKEHAKPGLEAILKLTSDHGFGSFLAVLKAFGPENKNYLSFPKEGYTLALDFKYQNALLPFLKKLDEIVIAHEGRFYLAKDARLSADYFQQGYPYIEKLREVRARYKLESIKSFQSIRLGL